MAGRFVAVTAFVTVAALLFIVMSPSLRKSDASSTSAKIAGSIKAEVTGSTNAAPQSSQDQNEAKPALAEFQGVLASIPTSKPPTAPEQPPQLLQQFLQWRQKANSTETPQ
jgi:hypothetical protein